MLSAPTQRLVRRATLAAPPFLLALAILVGSSYRAATREQAASLLSTGETVLGQTISYPAGKPAKVTAAVITMLPGEATGWHQHDVPMFDYILEGEVTVDYGAQGTASIAAGTRAWRRSLWPTTGAIPAPGRRASSRYSWAPTACPIQ